MDCQTRKSDEASCVKNSISIPRDIFVLLKSKGIPPNIASGLGSAGVTEVEIHARTFVDRYELPVSVREVPLQLCRHVFMPKVTALYVRFGNIEWYWKVFCNSQSPRHIDVAPTPPHSQLTLALLGIQIQSTTVDKKLNNLDLVFLQNFRRPKKEYSSFVRHFHGNEGPQCVRFLNVSRFLRLSSMAALYLLIRLLFFFICVFLESIHFQNRRNQNTNLLLQLFNPLRQCA